LSLSHQSREELFLLWKRWDKSNKGPLFPLDAQEFHLPGHLHKAYRFLWYSFDGLSQELGQQLKKGWSKTPRDWRRVLLLAASEWLWDESDQAYATLSQWGDVCRKHCGETALKVVNGTLRALLRKHGKIDDLSILKFLPNRLVEIWSQSGKQEAELIEMLKAPRVQFFSPLEVWESPSAGFHLCDQSSGVYRLDHGLSPGDVVKDHAGFFQNIQASELVEEVLKKKQSGDILDYCCAPGGKSWQLARLQKQPFDIFLYEANPKRAEKVKESPMLKAFEACRWLEEDQLNQRTFDNILIDVPCGNSGVLVKSPEAMKFLWYPNDDCAQVQNEILQKALGLLKDEGRLFYSTCSIDAIENSYRIQRFCESMSLQLVFEKQWWPDAEGCHGAYLACLEW
jgi:16S rRNA (cytosine967-C5)-methyltransferase